MSGKRPPEGPAIRRRGVDATTLAPYIIDKKPKTGAELADIARALTWELDRIYPRINDVGSIFASAKGLKGGIVAWARFRAAVAFAYCMEQTFPESNKTIERKLLRQISRLVDRAIEGLKQLQPVPAYDVEMSYRELKGQPKSTGSPEIPHLEFAIGDLSHLTTALETATRESEERGNGTAKDETAWQLANEIWNILSEAQIFSDTQPGSAFARCLDVALPFISSRIATQTVLAKIGKDSVTIRPKKRADWRPPTAEEMIASNRELSKKTRVSRK